MMIDTPPSMNTLFAALPDTLRDRLRVPIASAVARAFPNGTLQAITPLHGGMSQAIVVKIVVDEMPYVLRVIQQRTPFTDPVRQFACMQLAAQAGIAPMVHFADNAMGVSIIDYVTPSSPSSAPRDIAQLGGLLRQLHTGPAFPEFMTTFQAIDTVRAQLVQAGVQLPRVSHELLESFDELRPLITPHLVSTPCHSDLNPGNVLCDGTRQWLIDWDSGGMNDPIYDVACTIQWFLLDVERERVLLHAYFARAPYAHEIAKLTLMKQVAGCFYMLLFQLMSLGPDGLGDLDSIDVNTLPTLAGFLGAVGRGEECLQDVAGRRRISVVLAMEGVRARQGVSYRDALTLLSA